jgi:hypothetical protein
MGMHYQMEWSIGRRRRVARRTGLRALVLAAVDLGFGLLEFAIGTIVRAVVLVVGTGWHLARFGLRMAVGVLLSPVWLARWLVHGSGPKRASERWRPVHPAPETRRRPRPTIASVKPVWAGLDEL